MDFLQERTLLFHLTWFLIKPDGHCDSFNLNVFVVGDNAAICFIISSVSLAN